jgi:hypothetical protein
MITRTRAALRHGNVGFRWWKAFAGLQQSNCFFPVSGNRVYYGYEIWVISWADEDYFEEAECSVFGPHHKQEYRWHFPVPAWKQGKPGDPLPF